MITYPPPLPECTRCGSPMRRQAWHQTRGVCSGCLTVSEALQRVHSGHALARVAQAADRRAQIRIELLAARRAARGTRPP